MTASYLALLRETSAQSDYDLRAMFNGLHLIVKTGAPWRFMPQDPPPWPAVYQPTQRWLAAECFANVAGDLRAVLRMAGDREPEPSAVVLDSRTLRLTPESGERAGCDGAKRKRGAKVHLAADAPGHVVALHVTPASTNDRAEVGRLSAEVETSESIELAFVDQGSCGPKPVAPTSTHGIVLEVVKAPEAKGGFVLLPRRWEEDYERYASTSAGLHMTAFACLRLRQAGTLMASA